MPSWVKALLDDWLQAVNVTTGKVFRRVNKNSHTWGDGLTVKAVRHIVQEYAGKTGIDRLAPHDLSGDMCSTLPFCGWRVGANSVLARARLDSDRIGIEAGT